MKKEEVSSELLNTLTADVDPKRDVLELIFELLKTGIIVFVLAFLLRYFLIQPFLVDGQSMMPTFHDKEYLLVEKLSYLIGQPQRGDVVVFRYPKNPSVSYIKRIFGLPNETVVSDSNKITIKNSANPQGFVLSESYIPSEFNTAAFTGVDDNGVFTKSLKDNEYFVFGDNREHSSDSREWGPLPKANIIGRAWVTLFPLDRVSIHKRIKYDVSIVTSSLSNLRTLVFLDR
ncbi:MAG: signal peptidase I [Candidatus Berkelbacteria bacterium]|nr:signal peptidase I [Candidatus Berkelbacteria bacterium]